MEKTPQELKAAFADGTQATAAKFADLIDSAVPKLRHYLAYVSQTGTAGATAVVVYNNTGVTPEWSYGGTGTQVCRLADVDHADVFVPGGYHAIVDGGSVQVTVSDDGADALVTLVQRDSSGDAFNGYATALPLEIRLVVD